MHKGERVAVPKSTGFSRAMESENGKTNLEKIVKTYTEYSANELKSIPLDLLEDYPKHHYKAYSGDKFQNLCDSIERTGLYEPLIVNHIDNKYYILSGHNRRNALKSVYEKTKNEKFAVAPCLVKENLSDTICELIVQETNLTRRNFEDMDLQEKCENIHEYYEAVYSFYQENKDNIPKGFETREEVGNRLGMNYKTVEMYNRIYRYFSKDTNYYSFCPDYFDFTTAYEICKLSDKNITNLFDALIKLRENNTLVRIKKSQISDLVKLQGEGNNLSATEITKQLLNKEKNENSNSNDLDFKIPISSNSPYYEKIKTLDQEKFNMLEMEIKKVIMTFFDEKNS